MIVGIISLLATLVLSLLVTRVASMALMLTGVSREMARFQARSAFSGCGFTTKESEGLVSHPVRRRIIMLLMLLGNIGVATVAASVMVSIVRANEGSDQIIVAVCVLAGGVFTLVLVARSRRIERQLNKLIAWSLRRFTELDVRDYVAVLQLQNGYAVLELLVGRGDWVVESSLIELKLASEGVLVLGINRPDGSYVGAPTASTVIASGDSLVLYGPISLLEELGKRKKGARGDSAHLEAISVHQSLLAEQDNEERDQDPNRGVKQYSD
jgi:hypothetical protein